MRVDGLASVMEPELNCSSQCDSPLCFIHSGVNRQDGLHILQRLCTLSSVITHTQADIHLINTVCLVLQNIEGLKTFVYIDTYAVYYIDSACNKITLSYITETTHRNEINWTKAFRKCVIYHLSSQFNSTEPDMWSHWTSEAIFSTITVAGAFKRRLSEDRRHEAGTRMSNVTFQIETK